MASQYPSSCSHLSTLQRICTYQGCGLRREIASSSIKFLRSQTNYSNQDQREALIDLHATKLNTIFITDELIGYLILGNSLHDKAQNMSLQSKQRKIGSKNRANMGKAISMLRKPTDASRNPEVTNVRRESEPKIVQSNQKHWPS